MRAIRRTLYSRSSQDSSGVLDLVPILLYTVNPEGKNENVDGGSTCETICFNLCFQLGISPVMQNLFSLVMMREDQDRNLWLCPRDIVTHTMLDTKTKLHFRMRFLPTSGNIKLLLKNEEKTFKYLFCQIKWDFLHENSMIVNTNEKEEDIRGVTVILILTLLRYNTARENSDGESIKSFIKKTSFESFLPPLLKQKGVMDKRILKTSVTTKLEELCEMYKDRNGNGHYLQFMKSFLEHMLHEHNEYYIDQYSCLELEYKEIRETSVDSGGSAGVYFAPYLCGENVKVSMEKMGRLSRLLISGEKPDEIIIIPMESLSRVIIDEKKMKSTTTDGSQDFFQVQVDSTTSQSRMLNFKDWGSCMSFVSGLDLYYRLMFDFYMQLCPIVMSQCLEDLTTIRAHGPVSDKYLKQQLSRNKPQCSEYYALRSHLLEFNTYDVVYLPKHDGPLKVVKLKQITRAPEGYSVEGKELQPDLRLLIKTLVKDTGILPDSCQRQNPASKGGSVCDRLQELLMEQRDAQLISTDFEEEMQARRNLETRAKVYLPNAVTELNLAGVGYFTEVYRGKLNMNGNMDDEEIAVTIKQLRNDPVIVKHHRDIQQALTDGCGKLMKLSKPSFFVNYLGVVLNSSLSMVFSKSSFGTLRQFLQHPEERMFQLQLHHLLDASVHLAEALQYMEAQNCYHGNIHCDNIVVDGFDSSLLQVKLTEPGLVSLYDQLPIHHVINAKRLPWLAPERMVKLSTITEKTEVWSLGTTLWQIFAGGHSPLVADQQLRGKTQHQLKELFKSGTRLSCPEYLKQLSTDEKRIQDLKKSFYEEICTCWMPDASERPGPKLLLKNLLTSKQCIDGDYHLYNIVDTAEELAYPLQSGGATSQRHTSSGIESVPQPVTVPDLSCLNPLVADPQHAPADLGQELPRVNGLDRPAMLPTQGGFPGLDSREQRRAAGLPMLSRPPGGPPEFRLNQRAQPLIPIQDFIIPCDRLTIDKSKSGELGKGFYGSVFKAKLILGDNLSIDVVAKLLRDDRKEQFQTEFRKEASLMKTLEHENVVKFHGTCESHYGFCLVMDFMTEKSLVIYLKGRRERLKDDKLIRLAHNISAGMEYLSSRNIIHCDLAARNILLTSDHVAKVSDFGLSRVLQMDEDYYRRKSEGNIPIYWCAPEWTTTKVISTKSDVWSYGVVLWEMFSYGKEPRFENKTIPEFVQLLVNGARLPKPDGCPQEMYKLMEMCWHKKPENRPTFSDCCTRLGNLLGHGVVRLPKPMAHEQAIILSGVQVNFSDPTMKLGEGQFGEVWKGKYRNRDVAIKRCKTQTELGRFQKEYTLLYTLSSEAANPHIVKFIGLYASPRGERGEKAYVMEYMAHGCLSDRLQDCKNRGEPEPPEQKIRYLTDIATGMKYLFEKAIAHCDLTAVNILLDDRLTAKISDFGWSKQLQSSQEDFSYFRESALFREQWAAPETIGSQGYTKFSDIWSYGVLCIEVFLDGRTPALVPDCRDRNALWMRFQAGERYSRPDTCPEEIYDVILCCWNWEGKLRIHYPDIIQRFNRWREDQNQSSA